MWLIDQIAEQKIAEAIGKGEFDDLPGQGRPLDLDDDGLVPEELRVAYRVLKNSGFLPPEASLRRDIASVESLLTQAVSEEDQEHLNRRLNYLLLKLGTSRRESPCYTEAYYREKLAAKSRT